MAWSPPNTLAITDGEPLTGVVGGGRVVNFFEVESDPYRLGWGIEDLNQFNFDEGAEQVLPDPVSYIKDGTEARSAKTDNRVNSFAANLVGANHFDLHDRLNRLIAIAEQAKRYSIYRTGARPMLMWKPGFSGRAYYMPIRWMSVGVPSSYIGVALVSSRINQIKVNLTGDPTLKGYGRPIFYATAPEDAELLGQNPSLPITTGYYLVNRATQDYLQSDWLRTIDPSGAISITLWFRSEWMNNADGGNVRRFFSFHDGTHDLLMVAKESDGSWSANIQASPGVFTTLTLSAAQVDSIWTSTGWFGIHMRASIYAPGFVAYLFNDGMTLRENATVLPFTGAALNGGAWPFVFPTSLRIGGDVGMVAPARGHLNTAYGTTGVEFDGVQIGGFPGFQFPLDSRFLPFTRDPESIQVHYPHTITQARDDEAGTAGGAQRGRMNTLIRRPWGTRYPDLKTRIRNTAGHAIGRTKMWVTPQPINRAQSAWQRVFVNTNGANVPFTDVWSTITDARALDGQYAIQRAGYNDVHSPHGHWPDEMIFQKVISITGSAAGRMPPAAYVCFLRVMNIGPIGAYDYGGVTKMKLSVGGIFGPAITIPNTNSDIAPYMLVPMGVFAVPTNGEMPGGSYVFSVAAYLAQDYGFGTTGSDESFNAIKVDGVLMIPFGDEVPTLQMNWVGQSLSPDNPGGFVGSFLAAGSDELQTFYNHEPDTFRVAQANGYASDWAAANQEGRAPTLYHLLDNRLWVSQEVWDGAGGFFHYKDDTATVDLWVDPSLRTVG